MKKYLLYFLGAIIYLFLAGGSSFALAAISFVSTSSFGASGAATSITSTINTTAGNLLVVACQHGTTFVNPTNVTSSDQTTFTNFAIASNSDQGAVSGYYGIASTTASPVTVRCNFASSVSYRVIAIAQYSGVATTNPLDTTSTRSTSATTGKSFNTGAYTTTNANDVITTFAANIEEGTAVSTTGVGNFTTRIKVISGFGTGEADLITSTIQTNQSTTWTSVTAGSWSIILGAFKSASAAAQTYKAKNIIAGSTNFSGSSSFK